MNKQEFISALRAALNGLPQADVEERLAFYGEMIDDRVEDGMTESEAVESIGSVEDIAKQTLEDIPLTKLVRERVNTKRGMRPWEIILIVLGAPLWLALIIAAAAIVFSLYAVIAALIFSLWAVEASFIVSAFGCIAASAVIITRGDVMSGLFTLGSGLALAGVSILLFFVCVALTKLIFKLTRLIARGVKALFIRKERSV